MSFLEGVRLALEQIRAQKLKSFFAVLGIIVGVMFLVLVVSIVEGMDQYVRGTLTEKMFGVNTVTVRHRPRITVNPSRSQRRAWARAPRIKYDDLDYLVERLPAGLTIGVQSGTRGEVAGPNGRKVENVRLVGASAEMFKIRNWVAERGRVFTRQEAEAGIPVVVLGSSTVELLFQDLDPIGSTVRLRGFPFRVVGVLEEQGSFLGQSLDNLAIAPALSQIQGFTNAKGIVDEINIQGATPEEIPGIAQQAVELMRIRRRLRPIEENNFAVETAEESLSFWDNISKILFLALPLLVSVALVVGGIVIMNIMLVSVMERTREIGIRKAIGARRKDILVQILIEAVTLSAVGALAGVGIGAALTLFVGAVSPLPGVIAGKWMVAGVVLGMTVGVISGVYPAMRASRLDPVVALRAE